jgi:hypothetical protein
LFTFLENGKTMQCVYCLNDYQYKREWAFNHFDYFAKLAQALYIKLPTLMKWKFTSCGRIVLVAMSLLQIWGARGAPTSTRTMYSS